VIDLEKRLRRRTRNKQADEFKKYLATDFVAIDVEGIKNADAEVAEMQKTDMRNYSFADTKVVFPSANVAVITYTTQSTKRGGK